MTTRRNFPTLAGSGAFASVAMSLRTDPARAEPNSASDPNRQKTKIALISYGDVIEANENLSSMAATEKSFQAFYDAGYRTIYWRLNWEGHRTEDIIHYGSVGLEEFIRAQESFEKTPYAWDPYEIRWPIEVAHRLGMKLYAWIVIYNEGAPPGAFQQYEIPPQPVWYFPHQAVYETQFGYQTKFVHDHPEYQLVDREGKKYHYGVLEWAYPEARQYWMNDLKFILDKYDVDGVYLDTRVECMNPQFADQYGFNEPIVKEYLRRYGVNILEEDFDLEQWRSLRGEYLTLLLKEMSQPIHVKGKPFCVGTSRGDYIGYPLGNMKLHWREWISQKIVDELIMEVHGWGWSRQGYGYMTDFPTGRGLKPFRDSIREDYGPLCRQYGAKLYYARWACPVPSERSGIAYEPRSPKLQCCQSRGTMAALKLPLGWCDETAAMPEFDGIFDVPESLKGVTKKRAVW